MNPYPYTDDHGTLWLDASGFYSIEPPTRCFLCHHPCNRMDVNFGTYFCDTRECNEVIERDLSNWFEEGGHI